MAIPLIFAVIRRGLIIMEYKGRIKATIKNETLFNLVYPIVSAGFQYYQQGIDKMNKIERFKYLAKNKMGAIMMGNAVRLAGKELKDISQEIRDGLITLDIDVLDKGGIIIYNISSKTKERFDELIEKQSESLTKGIKAGVEITKEVL